MHHRRSGPRCRRSPPSPVPATPSRPSPSGSRRWSGWCTRTSSAGPGSPTGRVTSSWSSATRAWRFAGPGRTTSSSRSARRPTTSAPGSSGYHLDFPGNPLEAGCDYETWARTRPRAPRPRRTPMWSTEEGRDDRLALQYWFFYPFNDYTNKHEGDWEMIQLVFAAPDATEALDQTPLEVGYSQHEGLEVADWDDPKLADRRQHPPGRAPGRRLARQLLRLRALPRHVRRAGFRLRRHPRPERRRASRRHRHPRRSGGRAHRFPWIAYQGRWGQREQSFYNGPTGPNTKDSWTHPITYQEDEGPRPQLRRARRRPLGHLRHGLLLQRRLERVGGRPQARQQPLAPAPDPGPDPAPGGLPAPPDDVAPGRTRCASLDDARAGRSSARPGACTHRDGGCSSGSASSPSPSPSSWPACRA